ncbi:hypothetical protein A3B46_02915 [Candidatus Roizmanbacteria bacterium RIFCSPLOWO2_01_FULL_39_19]|nr:MAG: hypothetical protein A3B46_02915 [Candidatus Roizmanbacteria bacterium RIFCSPLOWO2_01_FULL_39_19]
MTIQSGKENYAKSKRLFKQALYKNDTRYLQITFVYLPNYSIDKQFDNFIHGVSLALSHNTFSVFSSFTVFAAEAIDGIPTTSFKEAKVMGDPLPESITTSDIPYKNGFAKPYIFTAIQGQRLTVVALEEQSDQPRSFIETELFDLNGNSLDSKDTRTEFIPPYTSTYYAIVHTFDNQVGNYFFKIFDRSQTENLLTLKRDDGSEQLIDPANGLPPVYGQQNVSLLLQFVNPISITDNIVRYVAKSREFELGLGPISSPVYVYMTDQSYSELLAQPSSVLPESDESNRVQITLQQIDQNKVLITPLNGISFPANKHIVLTEKTLGSMRVFTENPDKIQVSPSSSPAVSAQPTVQVGTGSISGKVTEKDGKPLTKTATVELVKILQHLPNGAQEYQTITKINTESDGTFRINNLPEGEYNLYIGGEYSSNRPIGWQNPIFLSKDQVLENINTETFY